MFHYYIFVSSFLLFSGYAFYKDIHNFEDTTIILEKYEKAIRLSLFNIILVSYLVFYCFEHYIYTPVYRDLNILESIEHIIISNIVGQVLFYSSHRLFHNVPQLQQLHKVHHEYRMPIGIQAAYSHPIDFVFGNMVPLTIVPYILEMNAYLLPFIIILGIYKTVFVDHSDYSDDSKHHINHHKYYNCNYGDKWIDQLLNTCNDI